MLLNDMGPLLTSVQFQLSLYDGCRPVYMFSRQKLKSLAFQDKTSGLWQHKRSAYNFQPEMSYSIYAIVTKLVHRCNDYL